MALLPRRTIGLSPLLLPLLGAACVGPGDVGTAVVHNQRPFVSTDSKTTKASHLEVEAGAQIDPGEAVDTPVFLKYGLAERTEAFAGMSVYRMVDRDEALPDGSGFGDSWLGLRQRLRDRDMYYPGFGFELLMKLPSASESKGLGTGEIDAFGAISASQTYEGNNVTAFYRGGILGETTDAGFDAQHTFALAVRTPFEKRFTFLGEAAYVWTPEQDWEEPTLYGGISYLLDDFTLFDIGLRLGAGDAPDFQLVFGLSRTLGLLDFAASSSER